MHLRTIQRPLILLVFLCLPLIAYGQGLYWETSTSVPMMQGQTIETKSYYLPRMFKQGSETEAVIFRLDKQMMYQVDYKEKEYSEISFADLEKYVKAASDQVKAQLADLKQQLASMPEDQRKMMEQMMGVTGGADDSARVEVTKTAETMTISGMKCTKYSLKKGATEAATVWTTGDVQDFAGMQKDFREFSAKLAEQMSVSGPQMSEAMAKVEGFPVQTTISGMTATVKKVSKMAVAKSDFEVPAGYKKVPFEEEKHGMEDMEGEEGADDDGGL